MTKDYTFDGTLSSRPPFIFLDHPAEVKFQATGTDLPELFAHAAHALVSCLLEKPLNPQDCTVKKEVHLLSSSIEDLLHQFLSSIIVLVDADDFVPGSMPELRISKEDDEYMLHAVFSGAACQHALFKSDVKSVTHHQLSVLEKSGMFVATVVLDV